MFWFLQGADKRPPGGIRRNKSRWFFIQTVVKLSQDMMDAKSLVELTE